MAHCCTGDSGEIVDLLTSVISQIENSVGLAVEYAKHGRREGRGAELQVFIMQSCIVLSVVFAVFAVFTVF